MLADINREEIRLVVREYILAEFLSGEDPEALKDQTSLISSGILDSIATAKLVAYLEDRFAVRFSAHEMGAANLDTVDRVVSTIERKLPQ